MSGQRRTIQFLAAVEHGATYLTSVLAAALLVAAAAPLSAQTQKPAKPSDNYDELYQRYLSQARQSAPAANDAASWAWMTDLNLDHRARRVNDVITIRVLESVTATGTADSALSKKSDASAGVPTLFGLEHNVPRGLDPSNLASLKTATDFKGAGSTTRAGSLTALVTARVAEVLPNGDLVVEGVREIEINSDRQVVVLTGVVRIADVAPDNVVASTAIAQFRIRYFGTGLMKDNLKPGWLVRILNKVF